MELLNAYWFSTYIPLGVTIHRHTAVDLVGVRCTCCELELLLFTSLMLVEFMSSGADVRLTDGRRTSGLLRSNTEKGLIGSVTCKNALL